MRMRGNGQWKPCEPGPASRIGVAEESHLSEGVVSATMGGCPPQAPSPLVIAVNSQHLT